MIKTKQALDYEYIVRWILAIFLCVIFAGCATNGSYPNDSTALGNLSIHLKQLHRGMHRIEVEQIIGPSEVFGGANISGIVPEFYVFDYNGSKFGVWLQYSVQNMHKDGPNDVLLSAPTKVSVREGPRWKEISITRQ